MAGRLPPSRSTGVFISLSGVRFILGNIFTQCLTCDPRHIDRYHRCHEESAGQEDKFQGRFPGIPGGSFQSRFSDIPEVYVKDRPRHHPDPTRQDVMPELYRCQAQEIVEGVEREDRAETQKKYDLASFFPYRGVDRLEFLIPGTAVGTPCPAPDIGRSESSETHPQRNQWIPRSSHRQPRK